MRTATAQPGLFDDLADDAESAAAVFEVRFRSPSGGRWKTVATVATHSEAIASIDRSGDWWVCTRTTGED